MAFAAFFIPAGQFRTGFAAGGGHFAEKKLCQIVASQLQTGERF
jgi:hypothetical protein